MSSVLVVAVPIVLLGGAGPGCPDLPHLVCRGGGCGPLRCAVWSCGRRACSEPADCFLPLGSPPSCVRPTECTALAYPTAHAPVPGTASRGRCGEREWQGWKCAAVYHCVPPCWTVF